MLIILKAGKSYHTFEKMIMKMTIMKREGQKEELKGYGGVEPFRKALDGLGL